MSESIHLKYLIANEQDEAWGLTIKTVGYQQILPYSPYPPGNHPQRYLFSTWKGRVLDEYQLLYLSKGKGVFMSESCGKTNIEAGDFFLLFPGEWHTYNPLDEAGWDEYWIGFTGINMDNRVAGGFFSKSNPVYHVGINEEIVNVYKQAIVTAIKQEIGFQQMLAGIVNYLLGFAYSKDKVQEFENLQVVNQINKSKIILNESYATNINLEEVAQEVNMSYSWFRRIFKQYTGFSPSQYLQELRFQKSKELLTNTMKSVKEISYEVGFENPDYFCTAFRKKTGMTPVHYRDFTQGKYLQSPV